MRLRSGLWRRALFCAAALSVAGCRGTVRLSESDAAAVLAQHTLDAPNPALPGPFAVRTLFYGTGGDLRRPEYRDSLTLRTRSVDGSKLVARGDWNAARTKYWGFDRDSLPLNGRVWYPEGPGPFPLVLVVHGNHDPRDFSDPGYEYLGRLLASRGFILASVDQNFINGSIQQENDARGWLLLEHLREWRRFNAAADNPFRGRIDLERVVLIGHSRGGEAVGHAAAFNRITRYPDDASLTFDFGFGIRGLIAIAPVDAQYMPAGQRVPVEDVSYLVFHGSHDGDVTSFQGLKQYDRVTFTKTGAGFKAAVFVYRANHGQWNSLWGARDNGPRSARILDLRPLLSAEEQREFAEVYVSAFLETTLHEDVRYLPLFRDHRVAGEWLPRTMFVTRFQDASFRPLANFEEDIDVGSGTEPGVRIEGDSLESWREDDLEFRSRRNNAPTSQENQALWLGWNNRVAAGDSTLPGRPASFTLHLPPELPERFALGPATSLELSLTATDRLPRPRAGRPAGGSGGGDTDDEEKPPVDLSVELEDDAGARARVALSRYGPVRRPLETRILRRADLERQRFPTPAELVLQGYSIPLSDFIEAIPSLRVDRLAAVRLVFDRADLGEVVIDDVGFAQLGPDWWRARVR